MTAIRKLAYLSIAAALLVLVGCASDSGTDSSTNTTSAPSATGPAPGVTADSIKIGVTYVDTAALAKVGLNFNLGDHKAVYQALFDDINNNGGINGRKIVPVYAPIDPTGTASAEAACLKLTEDDDVFMVTGFWLNDAVLCPVDAHATAVTGGNMTAQRLAQAKAPWLTWNPDTDQSEQVVRALNDAGELGGKVAVFGDSREADLTNDHVLPVLKELGIEPVATGLVDAPLDDTAALTNNVQLIAERFKAAGADTVILVGPSGQNYPTYMQNDPYHPKLLFLDTTASHAFSSNASTTDFSLLDGAVAGGSYGPEDARFKEPAMQACIATLTAAGLDTPEPQVSSDPGNQPYQAAFQACPDVALLKAWIEAAGPELNYGTLSTAISDGVKVTIPGDPAERTFGPAPAADGNPTAYLFTWDAARKDFVPKGN